MKENKRNGSIILPPGVRTFVRTFLYTIAEKIHEDDWKIIFEIEGEKYILYKTTGTFQYPIPLNSTVETLLIETLSKNLQFPQIGTDESGKGDIFGPLVVAGVKIEKKDLKKLIELGIKDSKKLSDKNIQLIKSAILKGFKHEVVLISPQKYNELHKKMHNINRILAWAHARVIENLLSSTDASLIIIDRFADTEFIRSFLFEKGSKKDYIIEPKAEQYLSTALASIIARIHYVEYLKELESKYNMQFPPGAGEQAEEALRDFIKKYGTSALNKIAKLHFKNVEKIKEGGNRPPS